MVSLLRKPLIPSMAKRTCVLAQAARTVLFGIVWLSATAVAWSQTPPVHYQHAGDMPPGAIGLRQLARGGPLRGYFQPVRVLAPTGVSISTANTGIFDPGQPAPLTVGLMIGEAYRFRVTGIPRYEGYEVYPTIEVVDRMYPPPGQKSRFPIPIELTLEELQMALAGKMVTRVIYIEDPRTALPLPEEPSFQRYFEVLPGEDSLEVADRLGRPVAILRMGSRLPSLEGPDAAFLFGSPPLERYVLPVVSQPPARVENPANAVQLQYVQPRPIARPSPGILSHPR